VPQIFIGERHVGGCDDLYALDSRGELDRLLAAEAGSLASSGKAR
jgi:glutaredoxin 3